MNIFKAKEIYKRIPGLPSSENPLRVIRGLWVSGTHLDILTEDAFIQLSDFDTTPCDIRHYTETTGEWKWADSNVKFTGLYDTGFDITNYYTTSTTWDNDPNVEFVDIYDQPLEITDYSTASTEFNNENNVQYMTLYDTAVVLEAYNYPIYTTLPDHTGLNPAEPTLEIVRYTSTDLEYDFNN